MAPARRVWAGKGRLALAARNLFVAMIYDLDEEAVVGPYVKSGDAMTRAICCK
jgi:hypothetical protein